MPLGISDTEEVRLQFLEHLLSTYQEMEGSFMKEVYELYKGFRFRTLWETDDPLPQFQRVASEGAQGGRLNAIVELTNVLTSIQSLEADAVTCFSNNRPSTGIQRWSFSTTTHESVSNITRSLRCFDTVFQEPYLMFLISFLSDFPPSDRCEIYTTYSSWIEI